MKDNKLTQFAASFLLVTSMTVGFQGLSLAASNTVTEIAPANTLTPGVWEANDVRPGGTAAIVNLMGLGGDLAANQPLPIGAVELTTNFTNAAKGEIGVYNDYGLAGDIIPSLQVAYDFFKASNPGQNLAGAPSLKLAFYNSVCTDPISAGDCYGELVYEPYWQGASNPAVDVWTPVSINGTTGKFWWTGGFGLPNTAGGPPLYTLDEFLAAAIQASDGTGDFPGASLVRVSIGVGSYNQGQIGYFDDVSISHAFGGGFSEAYDFEPPPPAVIPTLSTWSIVLMTLLLGILGFAVLGRKKTA